MSKGLEALNLLKYDLEIESEAQCERVCANFNIVKKELEEGEKAHEKNKKLEETMKLIVRKRFRWEMANASLEFYNERVSLEQRLTETEFNQIKEVIDKYGK